MNNELGQMSSRGMIIILFVLAGTAGVMYWIANLILNNI